MTINFVSRCSENSWSDDNNSKWYSVVVHRSYSRRSWRNSRRSKASCRESLNFWTKRQFICWFGCIFLLLKNGLHIDREFVSCVCVYYNVFIVYCIHLFLFYILIVYGTIWNYVKTLISTKLVGLIQLVRFNNMILHYITFFKPSSHLWQQSFFPPSRIIS